MKLNDHKCKNAKPKEKTYKLSDGGGLYLEVMPAVGKLWRLKYRFGSKEKRLSFGNYPIISLKEARDKRDDAKLIIQNGDDHAIVNREEEAKIDYTKIFFEKLQKEIPDVEIAYKIRINKK